MWGAAPVLSDGYDPPGQVLWFSILCQWGEVGLGPAFSVYFGEITQCPEVDLLKMAGLRTP